MGVCATDRDVTSWLILPPQALVAHAHTVVMNPVLVAGFQLPGYVTISSAPIHMGLGCLQQQSCALPLGATGTAEEGDNWEGLTPLLQLHQCL